MIPPLQDNLIVYMPPSNMIDFSSGAHSCLVVSGMDMSMSRVMIALHAGNRVLPTLCVAQLLRSLHSRTAPRPPTSTSIGSRGGGGSEVLMAHDGP